MTTRFFDGIETDLKRLASRHTQGSELGQVILNAMQKEGLTYEEAYAGLDYAYAALRFSANFAQIQPAHIWSLEEQLREERDQIRRSH